MSKARELLKLKSFEINDLAIGDLLIFDVSDPLVSFKGEEINTITAIKVGGKKFKRGTDVPYDDIDNAQIEIKTDRGNKQLLTLDQALQADILEK